MKIRQSHLSLTYNIKSGEAGSKGMPLADSSKGVPIEELGVDFIPCNGLAIQKTFGIQLLTLKGIFNYFQYSNKKAFNF